MANKQRRSWHEGSIYQRGDGRWCASVMANGKRISYYSTTRRGVVDNLASWHRNKSRWTKPSDQKEGSK